MTEITFTENKLHNLVNMLGEKRKHFPGCGLRRKFKPEDCPQCHDYFNGHTFLDDTDGNDLCRKMVENREWFDFWWYAQSSWIESDDDNDIEPGLSWHPILDRWLFLKPGRIAKLVCEWKGWK